MSPRQRERVLTFLASAYLPLPPSANNSYVNLPRGRARSQRLKDWEVHAGWIWKMEGIMPGRAFPRTMTWGWDGEFYFPTSAQRDLDNCYKHITDLIVTMVFAGKPDDRYLVWDQHMKLVDRVRPGVMVRVYEVTHDGVPPRSLAAVTRA